MAASSSSPRLPILVRVNAITWPSGDQAAPPPSTIACAAEPSTLMTQMAGCEPPPPRVNASDRPSGAQDGPESPTAPPPVSRRWSAPPASMIQIAPSRTNAS